MPNVTRVQFCPYDRLLHCVCSSLGASVTFLQAHLISLEGKLYEQTGPLHWGALGCFRVEILLLVVRTEMLLVPGRVSHLVPVELHIWLPRATKFLLCVFEHFCIVEHLSSYSELNYYVPTSLTFFFPLQISAFALHLLTFCIVTVKAVLTLCPWDGGFMGV